MAWPKKKVEQVGILPLETRILEVTVEGLDRLVTHAWDPKTRAQIAGKHQGVALPPRSKRDPQAEYEAALYRVPGRPGRYGVPATAFKSAMIEAAHTFAPIARNLVRGALFVLGDILEVDATPQMRTDMARLDSGVPTPRYRPEFVNWRCTLRIEYEVTSITPDQIVNLLNRAGFHIGIGEHRPEKSGNTWGRFRVVPSGKKKSTRTAK